MNNEELWAMLLQELEELIAELEELCKYAIQVNKFYFKQIIHLSDPQSPLLG